jgi:hypothetical protein
MYVKCPKCGHAPLPENQASPAACPGCGVILAKLAAMAVGARASAQAAAAGIVVPAAAATQEAPDAGATQAGWGERIVDRFTFVPEEVVRMHWLGRIAALAGLALWTVFIFKSADVPGGEVGSGFLHLVLLPFHEFGHKLFSPFGNVMLYAGGAFGQWLMPVILAGALMIKRDDTFGGAVFTWLLGFSVLDIAVYMYDAYDPHLMLLTGYTGAESANHDFIQVFGDLGLLNQARGIGRFFGALGRLLMLASLAWGAWLLWVQSRRLGDGGPTAQDLLG